MGKTVSAGNANPGYRSSGANRPQGLPPGLSAYVRALLTHSVLLGYGISLAAICLLGLAVRYAGPAGLLLLPAVAGMLALSALRHVMTVGEMKAPRSFPGGSCGPPVQPHSPPAEEQEGQESSSCR